MRYPSPTWGSWGIPLHSMPLRCQHSTTVAQASSLRWGITCTNATSPWPATPSDPHPGSRTVRLTSGQARCKRRACSSSPLPAGAPLYHAPVREHGWRDSMATARQTCDTCIFEHKPISRRCVISRRAQQERWFCVSALRCGAAVIVG